ncbi:hypothetical protein KOI35_40180 [Actinoplanes bogorensis]|uniref:Uncharacterized protein n=1 Tax=Paractinoplanes bogorensis TaxID=1610840 RepID=A0ABS5Z222_9ACTN|nr:hypothetical protein [Actinoplanes bogorensis]MBU2669745.1 hypothetical protein [Actinoplanes bogorensis]
MAMGMWLATVSFEDGSVIYAQYSTVVEALLESLYESACPIGGTLPDGSHCYRATVTGEPLRSSRSKPPSASDDMRLVEIETEPDATRWYALYCPSRQMIVGPPSSHHQSRLHEEFDLVRDPAGVRHLRRDTGDDVTACGHHRPGPGLGFLRPRNGFDIEPPDPGPPTDLYAEWNSPDLCRQCLLACASETWS